jgi:phosphoenolpyruvate synthase/pyruvate phosphate dikinase
LSEKTGLERHSKEFQKIFSNMISPERPSFMIIEREDLEKIAAIIRKDKQSLKIFKERDPKEIMSKISPELLKAISEHQKRFFYHQLDFFNGDALTGQDYTSELKKMLQEENPETQKKVSESEMKKNSISARKQMVKQYKLGKDAEELMDIGVRFLHMQDDRKKHILMGIYHLNLLLRQISRRYKIPVEELKRYSPLELTESSLKDFDHEDAKARIESAVYIFRRKQERLNYRVLTGAECAKAVEMLKKKHTEGTDLHGMPAELGKATGTVMICRTKEDLARFQEGMVLVASMTRPEFVSIMRKAAAIVTDEGGITCHAAIVARELKKPCIIGTKVATKVLKDGDVVEVNANHGIVHKIN